MYFGNKHYEKFVETLDEKGNVVKPGVEYDLTEDQLKAIDPRDYKILNEDGEEVAPPSKKKVAKKGEEK